VNDDECENWYSWQETTLLACVLDQNITLYKDCAVSATSLWKRAETSVRQGWQKEKWVGSVN
jgi:hypothetical protein